VKRHCFIESHQPATGGRGEECELVVESLDQSCQPDTRRKRRGAELPSRQGSNKEPVSNNRIEGKALEPPINDKELFNDIDPVSS
jgi:hypothetical protein